MDYKILVNGNLKIFLEAGDKEDIQARIEDNAENKRGWSSLWIDVLEPLICNSDLDYCAPVELGALTSAPCLKVSDYDEETDAETIVHGWAYMDYAVKDPIEELLEHGKIILQVG